MLLVYNDLFMGLGLSLEINIEENGFHASDLKSCFVACEGFNRVEAAKEVRLRGRVLAKRPIL